MPKPFRSTLTSLISRFSTGTSIWQWGDHLLKGPQLGQDISMNTTIPTSFPPQASIFGKILRPMWRQERTGKNIMCCPQELSKPKLLTESLTSSTKNMIDMMEGMRNLSRENEVLPTLISQQLSRTTARSMQQGLCTVRLTSAEITRATVLTPQGLTTLQLTTCIS